MDFDELERLAALMKQANIGELTLRQGTSRLTLRKAPSEAIESMHPLPLSPGGMEAPEYDGEYMTLAETGEEAGVAPVVFITSPLVGVFHHTKPVVGLGATVKGGQTVGVIESMNLVHEVAASGAGVVTDVLIEEGVVVEYGQRLFAVRSDEP